MLIMRHPYILSIVITRHILYHLLILGSLCLSLIVQAQITDTDIQPGTLLRGRLDDETARRVYFYDGSRGEVLRLRLQAINGDLDPVLMVFDNAGTLILKQDDQQGSRNIDTSLTLDRTDRFYIVVGRFGYRLGSTQGDFELALERVGILSRPGTALRYGIPIIDTITNTQPQMYYTVQANAGDILNIEMIRNSGNLDPYLQVVDSDSFLIADNDDGDSEGRNARINNLLVETSGTYIIIASRYGQAAGNSVGSFVLTISEADNSGLGNSTLAPATILYNQSIEGDLNDTQYERYYTFEGRQDDIITITLDQTRGRLDAYLILADAGLRPLAQDDDGGSGRNARIDGYRLPANGVYTIIATRFERADGDSAGGYRLQLLREGNAYDDVVADIARITYGTNIRNTISVERGDNLYAFWGEQGDTVRISMNRGSGNLDAVIELLDTQQRRILYDDDSGNGNNARIDGYTLTYTGVHYIRATRYTGNSKPDDTVGDYNLVLTQTD